MVGKDTGGQGEKWKVSVNEKRERVAWCSGEEKKEV